MTSAPSIHRPGVLEAAGPASGLHPEALRRLRNAIYKHGVPPRQALAVLPPRAVSELAERVALDCLREVVRQDSSSDGATKLVFATDAGLALESVILRIRSGRTAVCVSSQIGCAARCRFCATGQMARVRNLAVEEILEQVVVAGQLLRARGARLRNVVFMGMGEPMHNRLAVESAIDRLIDPKWFALSARHVMVSTVGVIDELRRFVERFPEINLALSLHTARQDVRERLIPFARHTPLAEIRRALLAMQDARSRPVMIEYLLLDGINDTDADLAALIEFCRGLHVRLNLMPFNPIAQAPSLRPSDPARQLTFSTTLKAAGFAVTTRFSLGKDIAVGCGQLIQT